SCSLFYLPAPSSSNPYASTTESLLVDPHDPQTLYRTETFSFMPGIGVLEISTTLTRSRDGGATWQAIGQPSTPGDGVFVTGLAADPGTAGVLYASTAESLFGTEPFRLFRSSDSGETWTLVNADKGGFVVVDPFAPSTLYSASDAATFKSVDG